MKKCKNIKIVSEWTKKYQNVSKLCQNDTNSVKMSEIEPKLYQNVSKSVPEIISALMKFCDLYLCLDM